MFLILGLFFSHYVTPSKAFQFFQRHDLLTNSVLQDLVLYLLGGGGIQQTIMS